MIGILRCNTKKRIIEVAAKLFAVQGFNGTSIREIAQLAKVNLSAVNYHFENKEKLYWLVFESNYLSIEKAVEKISLKKSLDTIDFSMELFDYFTKNRNSLQNTFQLFLNSGAVSEQRGLDLNFLKNLRPPGSEAFKKKLHIEFKDKANEEQIRWATDMIMAQLIHMSIVATTPLIKKKSKTDPKLSICFIRKCVCDSIKSHIQYIELAMKN
jgi:AcrR family transcriptional regulator